MSVRSAQDKREPLSSLDLKMAGTLRQFTCRDDLWARVEALAQRRGITSDEVIQAALIQLFSRKRGRADEGVAQGMPQPQPATRLPTRPASRPAGTPGGGRLPPPSGRANAAGSRPLFLFFEGQCYEIDQEQFVIGRGSKYSDLAIKDANISRRHCAVVRRNGQYYIKDLESTNGVEFNGQRVDNHLIQEGTSYKLCDHEIRFSFSPPG
jgi:hypothetical protein